MCPPWLGDDSLGNCHAEARSFRLRRKERLKDAGALLLRDARSLVAKRDLERRPAVESDLSAADPNLSFVRRSVAGVFENIAKDASDGETIGLAFDARAVELPRELRSAYCCACVSHPPRFAPQFAQIDALALQDDRRSILPDLFVKQLQMLLGSHRSGDEIERLGPVLDLENQHLQAGLAPLQGVAALVGQAGHRLADGRQPLGLQGPVCRFVESLASALVFQNLPQPGPQLVRVDRLEDVVFGPSLSAETALCTSANPVTMMTEAWGANCLMRGNKSSALPSGNRRSRITTSTFDQSRRGQSLGGRARGFHLEMVQFQNIAEIGPRVGVVVNDQDFGSRGKGHHSGGAIGVGHRANSSTVCSN